MKKVISTQELSYGEFYDEWTTLYDGILPDEEDEESAIREKYTRISLTKGSFMLPFDCFLYV